MRTPCPATCELPTRPGASASIQNAASAAHRTQGSVNTRALSVLPSPDVSALKATAAPNLHETLLQPAMMEVRSVPALCALPLIEHLRLDALQRRLCRCSLGCRFKQFCINGPPPTQVRFGNCTCTTPGNLHTQEPDAAGGQPKRPYDGSDGAYSHDGRGRAQRLSLGQPCQLQAGDSLVHVTVREILDVVAVAQQAHAAD
jgi:hypothetical protein